MRDLDISEESLTTLLGCPEFGFIVYFPAAYQVSSIYSLEDLQGLQNPEICNLVSRACEDERTKLHFTILQVSSEQDKIGFRVLVLRWIDWNKCC